MSSHGTRFVSKSIGIAMGWLYWYSFEMIVAYEVTAASLVINYWPNNIHIAVWITLMLFVIICLNMAPVKWYAESEFWFASLKVPMILGLLLLAFIMADPGAMNAYLVEGTGGRFYAFIYALAFSMFSFNFGPELIVLTSGEMRSPRKNLPTAAKKFVWRLITFYALSSLAISVICRSDAPGLTDGGYGAAASPWVIAIKQSGIRVLDSIINGGIILSEWSSGNSILYMSSRSLYSMAKSGNAPAIFARCNRWGVPVYATLASALFSPLAYLNVGNSTSQVFNWFINMTNTAGFTSWVCCCIILLRFRKACKAQGVTDIPFQPFLQPYASWICMVFFICLLGLNGFSVFFPGHWSISGFLTAYIGLPIFLANYGGHRIYQWSESWIIDLSEVDLHTGLGAIKSLEEEEIEREVPEKTGVKARAWRVVKSLWE
ncbi:hypothetical protein QQZ08_005184 [Neonectria magnoliae]|uniref:Amino acid permease/ SLC12A domain-containing protein n=1 Tax=Neonectria magnoliae TaxID=2732573 RepID=A0ABR1I5R8_9HYPO